MAQERPRVGVGVFVTRQRADGTTEFLMGGRRGSLEAGTWALPGGHLEFCESFEDCAVREVLEETGLALSEPTFLSCTNRIFDEKSGKRHYVSIYMKGSVERSSEPQLMEPDKCEGWKWVTWRELQEWVANRDKPGARRLFGGMVALVETRNVRL